MKHCLNLYPRALSRASRFTRDRLRSSSINSFPLDENIPFIITASLSFSTRDLDLLHTALFSQSIGVKVFLYSSFFSSYLAASKAEEKIAYCEYRSIEYEIYLAGRHVNTSNGQCSFVSLDWHAKRGTAY